MPNFLSEMQHQLLAPLMGFELASFFIPTNAKYYWIFKFLPNLQDKNILFWFSFPYLCVMLIIFMFISSYAYFCELF